MGGRLAGHGSPAHCRAYLDAASRPDTEAQLVGRMVHCAVLEPARFATDYCPAPAPADFPEALTDLASYKAAARAAFAFGEARTCRNRSRPDAASPGVARRPVTFLAPPRKVSKRRRLNFVSRAV